jgi:hypothetical protein
MRTLAYRLCDWHNAKVDANGLGRPIRNLASKGRRSIPNGPFALASGFLKVLLHAGRVRKEGCRFDHFRSARQVRSPGSGYCIRSTAGASYFYELKALLQRLQEQPQALDGPYAEHGHVLQLALRELDSPSATCADQKSSSVCCSVGTLYDLEALALVAGARNIGSTRSI